VVVPYKLGEGEHRQPVCATLIGGLFADDKILSVAHAVQRASRWYQTMTEAVRGQPFYRAA
jgi:hypothetical protein